MILKLKDWLGTLGPFPIIAAALVIAFGLAYCAGKRGAEINLKDKEIEVRKDLNDASEKAADTRVKEAVEAAKQEKELQDALETSENPDHQRVLRGCIIMRQQGRDVSLVPACSGLKAGS